MTKSELLAARNFEALKENPYPGRGIVLGFSPTIQALIQIYWIMGRSPNSQNRVFSSNNNGRLFTEAADPSKVTDPSLIIYDAMLEWNKETFVVSNGHQTNIIGRITGNDKVNFEHALSDWGYEPDEPNFTPRITGVCELKHPFLQLSIIRRSALSDYPERFQFQYSVGHGNLGHCLTTYSGDGNPLPSFQGEPLLLPLVGGIEEIRDTYWNALNPDNRVSLAVKSIAFPFGQSTISIVNRFSKV